jgi:hypothetical protein
MVDDEFEKRDLLPSSALSRIVTPKGMVQGVGGIWVPLYCANCGADCGFAPEYDAEEWFFLCGQGYNDCVTTWGPIAAQMAMPYEVFIAKVRREQIESYGRILNAEELAEVLEAGDSPLATLINSSRRG